MIINPARTRAAVPVWAGFACYHLQGFDGREWIGLHAGLVYDADRARQWVHGDDSVKPDDIMGRFVIDTAGAFRG